jgi:hypothetical protein
VACEFLAAFPLAAVEAGLTPSLGGLLDDKSSAFKGVNIGMGQRDSFVSLAGRDGSVSVADVASLTMVWMTTLRFPNRAAFEAWWPRNKDCHARLWYWALKRGGAKARDPQTAMKDLAGKDPAEALRLMLLAGNNAAKVVDSGLTEASQNGSDKPMPVMEVMDYPFGFPPQMVADFVRAHSFKPRLLRIAQQDIPWPEARGEQAVRGLWYAILPVLPLALDKSDAPAIQKLLEDPTALLAKPGNGDFRDGFTEVLLDLDPSLAEGILLKQLKAEAHQPLLAARLVAATGLKHWNLVQAACPDVNDKPPVIEALVKLGTPQAAAALDQWFNAQDWTPILNEYGYESNPNTEFLLDEYVKAAAAMNGGNPVVAKDLQDGAHWKARKGMTHEQIKEANKPVPAARVKVVAKLKEFFRAGRNGG